MTTESEPEAGPTGRAYGSIGTESDRALTASDRAVLWRLLSSDAWAVPALIGLGLVASLAESLGISLVVLFLYSWIGNLDQAVSEGVGGNFLARALEVVGDGYGLPVTIFVLIVLRGLISFLYSVVASHAKGRFSQRIRDRIHQQYVEVDYEFLRRREQGDLLYVLANASWDCADAFLGVTRAVINSCTIVVFSIAILLLSWQLLLVAGVGSLVLFLSLRLFSRSARRLGQRFTTINEQLADRMMISLQGMRVIRAYGQEAAHHRIFQSLSESVRQTLFRMESLLAVIHPATEIGYLMLLCLILLASSKISIPFATTLAVVALLYRLQPHVRELEGHLMSFAQLEAPMARVVRMLDREDKVYRPAGIRPFAKLGTEIRFDNVSFSFQQSTTPALDNASFTIPAGKVTVLMGPSGAGKTTVVNLLLRLYEPTGGTILVDGEKLSEFEPASWLSHVAAAGQDVDLVEGTVTENIRMADPLASLERVQEASRAAGVDEVIDALPQKYDTWIGAQGSNLSGGQRQRVGLARAILRSPDLLILDEATNALERRLREKVHSNLDRLFDGRTLLIVTHQLDAVSSADHLVCLNQGRVEASGSPADVASYLETLATDRSPG